MKMKCRIENKNLLNWSRMITTLTTVGDEEVHFAFTDSTLTLTVFNASLSVSGTCTFFNIFFQSFTIPRGYVKTFKLPTKCLMKPFRSTRFLKSCTFCDIEFEDDKDTIMITMGCRSLAEIKFTLQLSENSDELHADADPDNLANWIRADPKFMISNLNNFSQGKGLIDLTLKAQGNNLLMKNCATDLMRKENKVYTELTLSTLAFDRFAINEDTEVTFQLRDFKSFIALADYMKLAMTIHFQGPQDPVIVCVKSEQLEANLMLATKYVADPEMSLGGSSQASSALSTGISNVSSNGRQPQPRPARPPQPPPVVNVPINVPAPKPTLERPRKQGTSSRGENSGAEIEVVQQSEDMVPDSLPSRSSRKITSSRGGNDEPVINTPESLDIIPASFALPSPAEPMMDPDNSESEDFFSKSGPPKRKSPVEPMMDPGNSESEGLFSKSGPPKRKSPVEPMMDPGNSESEGLFSKSGPPKRKSPVEPMMDPGNSESQGLFSKSGPSKRKISPPTNNREDRENEPENNPPPQKRMLFSLLRQMSEPFDMCKKFPGHDIVLVEASDDDDDEDDS